MTAKRGLGRGLNALIREIPEDRESAPAAPSPEKAPAEPPTSGTAQQPAPANRIEVGRISRSSVQPRQIFAREAMDDLVRSVAEHGIMQPLLVRPKGADFELIAGERRLRAAQEAGLKDVPAIVVEADDRKALELAMIENLQRENLNPVEEAEGYQALAEDFALTQEQIAERVGKARASVANAMRLLVLPEEVKGYLSENRISAGHAKALLGLEIAEEQILLARRIINDRLSVREAEKIVEKIKRPARKPRAKRQDISAADLSRITDELRRHLGTSVHVVSCSTLANGKKTKGRVEVEFYSLEDFNRILDILGVSLGETV